MVPELRARDLLRALFDAALAAVDPVRCLKDMLPPPGSNPSVNPC